MGFKEYAVYKGDEFLYIGTVKQISEYFNVKKETVRYWISPANKRRIKGNGKLAIRIN